MHRFLMFAILLLSGPQLFAADEALERKASWTPPELPEIRDRVNAWMEERRVDAAEKERIVALWPQEVTAGFDPLDAVAASIAIVEPQAKEIIDLAGQAKLPKPVPMFPVLTDASAAPFVRNHLRLYYARRLMQQDLADECLEMMADLKATDVIDPASLYFYQAVAQHRLLDKEKCVAAVETLLENEGKIPLRFVRLAHLMAADIQPLKKDSLDEVSRMMEDVRRRLDHARAGKKVREEEEEIVAKLDKMIEEMEKQRQQQQQQQQGGGKGRPSPSAPAQDSKASELKGPGEVDMKNLGKKSGWGNLPPKERQEALQQIGKELPAHFRETIEEYFQRLAQDGVK